MNSVVLCEDSAGGKLELSSTSPNVINFGRVGMSLHHPYVEIQDLHIDEFKFNSGLTCTVFIVVITSIIFLVSSILLFCWY